MNQAFLQSHIQCRHPEDSHLEYKTRTQTDKLQSEIDMLKLQLTKSQRQAAQHVHAVKFSKEYEIQKTKEEEFLKLFDRWKDEEKEKLVDEMEKVKEMFMKEFKELTSKNSALEYVSIKPRSPHSIDRVVAFRGGMTMAIWPSDPQVPLSCPGPDSHPP